jgi:hypothetical protein
MAPHFRSYLNCILGKLREGIVATNRKDGFASDGLSLLVLVLDAPCLNLTVYETSLRMSILFSSAVNTASTLSYLLPTYYTPQPSSHSRDTTVLITLLSQLDPSHPSQRGYYGRREEFLASGLVARDSLTVSWLTSLAGAIRSCNYYKVETLTRPKVYMPLLGTRPPKPCEGVPDLDLSTVRVVISSLHDRLRDRSWPILQVAYREMTCLPEVTDTSEWLKRCLALDSSGTTVETWFQQQSEKGNVKAKEAKGKWIIIGPTPR